MSEPSQRPDAPRPGKVITPRASRRAALRGEQPTTPGGSRVVYPSRPSGSGVHRLWTNVSWRRRVVVVVAVALVCTGAVALARQPAPRPVPRDPSAAPGAGIATLPPPVATPATDSAVTAPAPDSAAAAPADAGSPSTIAGLLAAQQGEEPAGEATAVSAETQGAVAGVVASYAAAIDRRDVDALAGLYPAMTAAERASWTRFFERASNLHATLRVRELRPLADDAVEARVAGSYAYDAGAPSRPTRQPVEFFARLARGAHGRWGLTSVR